MRVPSWVRAARFLLPAAMGLALGGCDGGAQGPERGTTTIPASDASCAVAENWCIEHGVPEDICAQCNPKLAAEHQQKGDWCREHNRPQSQCFLCNPKLEAAFAAEYEAKYGKKPPTPEGESS